MLCYFVHISNATNFLCRNRNALMSMLGFFGITKVGRNKLWLSCLPWPGPQEFLITLREPVPQPSQHEGMPWFAMNCNKTKAEGLLRSVPIEGVFLVRPSEQDANSFTISFR